MSNPNQSRRRDLSTPQGQADLTEELELIRRAQSGSTPATQALWLRYRPLIAATATRAARDRNLSPAEQDDLEGDLTVVLLESIKTCPPDQPLSAILPARFAAVVAELKPAISIPRSTLARFHRIMKKADGDQRAALALAPSMGMSTETFLAVAGALSTTALDSAEEVAEHRDHSTPVDDHDLAHLALEALTARQREVVEWLFGFADGAPHSPDWVAAHLDLSRSYIIRTRDQSLSKMRKAIANQPQLTGVGR